jgi:hypothetical protein
MPHELQYNKYTALLNPYAHMSDQQQCFTRLMQAAAASEALFQEAPSGLS